MSIEEDLHEGMHEAKTCECFQKRPSAENEKRAREAGDSCDHLAIGIAACVPCIAAALDAAEARGRNQALQSEQHRTSYNIAFEEGRAEGERAERERIRTKAQALNAERRNMVAAELVLAMLAEEDRQRGAAGEEKPMRVNPFLEDGP